MNTGPFKLDIPLKQENNLHYWIIAGCIVCSISIAFFSVDFAVVFFASSIVGLPMLLPIALPGKKRLLFSKWGVLGRISAYVLIFGYIASAKAFIVPLLLEAMGHVITSIGN